MMAALCLVVAAGGAYAVGLFDPATDGAERSSLVADAQAAVTESTTLRAELTTEVAEAKAVLKGPDGKAAERPQRKALNTAIEDAEDLVTSLGSVTRSPSGTEEQASTVLGLASALTEEAPAATSALRDASRAVLMSGRQVRWGRAVSELEAARTDLQEVVTAGERAFAESAAAATASGESLRAELDSAADLDARAGELLETAADARAVAGAPADGSRQAGASSEVDAVLPESEVADLFGEFGKLVTAMTQTEVRLEEASAAVLAEAPEDVTAEADTADTDPVASPAPTEDASTETNTTPTGTCPEPDQVWSAENGHLSSAELAAIPFASGHYVRSDVAGGLAGLNDAYAAEFGVNLTINSSYRTYAQQEALYDPTSKTAAPPGCSNHGTGLAIDIGGGVQTFGSAQYDWLKANAEAYGWVHPPFAEPTGRNPEPWHWQSVQAPNSY